jgi:hypothetical protein
MSPGALPAGKWATSFVVLIQNMKMRSRRRASERRHRRLLWIYTLIVTMLLAGMAEDLRRLEDLLKVERVVMEVAVRRLASKVGTPTFGTEFFRPYINLRYLVDKELISDNKFRNEFRVDRATFHRRHDALQFPPVLQTANRLALGSWDVLLILFRRLGDLRGSQWLQNPEDTSEARSHASSC